MRLLLIHFAFAEKASSVAIASSAAASTSGSKSKLSSAELISMIRQGGPSATAGTPATTAAGAPSTRATSLKKADDEFPPLPKAATPPAAKDDYGMRGLLENIKRLPADKNIWAIGQEVESLGMPLDTPTPFTDAAMGGNSNASRLDSDWNVWGDDARQTLAASGEYKPSTLVPACFNQQPAPPASGKMASFSDETLFWIFYGMPRDRMQELAARTLYHLWRSPSHLSEIGCREDGDCTRRAAPGSRDATTRSSSNPTRIRMSGGLCLMFPSGIAIGGTLRASETKTLTSRPTSRLHWPASERRACTCPTGMHSGKRQ